MAKDCLWRTEKPVWKRRGETALRRREREPEWRGLGACVACDSRKQALQSGGGGGRVVSELDACFIQVKEDPQLNDLQ